MTEWLLSANPIIFGCMAGSAWMFVRGVGRTSDLHRRWKAMLSRAALEKTWSTATCLVERMGIHRDFIDIPKIPKETSEEEMEEIQRKLEERAFRNVELTRRHGGMLIGYSYVFRGKTYRSRVISLMDAFDRRDADPPYQLFYSLRPGDRTVAWVNPKRPSESVLQLTEKETLEKARFASLSKSILSEMCKTLIPLALGWLFFALSH